MTTSRKRGKPKHYNNHATPKMPSRRARSLSGIVRLSDIEARPIQWLWRNWIPKGKLTLVAGVAGVSKSSLMFHIAACVTRGAAFPDGSRSSAGDVLIVSSEDDPGDTHKPKLVAAGANCSRIRVLQSILDENGLERPVELAKDLNFIRDALRRCRAPKLLIVDPLAAFTRCADLYRDDRIRQLLQPYCQLAAELRIALVIVTHLSDDRPGPIANRLNGSIGLGALARTVLLVQRSAQDRNTYLLSVGKSNLVPTAAVEIPYTLQNVRLKGNLSAAKISFQAPHQPEVVAQEMAREQRRPPRISKLTQATIWLKARLAAKPLPATEVQRLAAAEGITLRTLQRAKELANVESRKRQLKSYWLIADHKPN